MKKNNLILLNIILFSLLYWSCNPTCEIVGDFQVNKTFTQPDQEVLITANPMHLLQGKIVYFGDVKVEANDISYNEAIGMQVKVPKNAKDGAILRLEDPDCGAIKQLSCSSNSISFYQKDPRFVLPFIPDIILPNISPLPFPSTIDKAWLSVEDPHYCLWFNLKKDTARDASKKPIYFNGKLVIDTTNLIDQYDPKVPSVEQTACAKDFGTSPIPYPKNPVYGTYNRKAPKGTVALHFFIDRTKNQGGIEEFEGIFLDYDKLPAKYQNVGKTPLCQGTTGLVQNRFLYITSKTTGLSYVLYHSGLGQ